MKVTGIARTPGPGLKCEKEGEKIWQTFGEERQQEAS